MKKSIYSVGKKQKNPHEKNIEKHSEKIKNSNYVFFVVRKLFIEREKMDFASRSIFFDIERSIENLKTGGVKLQRDMSVSKK